MSDTNQRTVVKKVEVGKYASGKTAYCVLYSDDTIRIDNVRFSHPHVGTPFKGQDDNGKEQSRFGVIAILSKETHAPAKDICVGAITAMLKSKQVEKIGSDKKFIRNGDDQAAKEYEGAWTVSAGDSKNAPDARDAGKRRLSAEEADKLFYGGAYGSILIRPWWQDNKYGKRANATLVAIQFVENGEPFGTGRISAKDVDDSFDDYEDEGGGGSFSGGSSDDDDL